MANFKIKFTKDFATKKKGESWECDSLLASRLIKRKVAVLDTKKETKTK